MGLEYPYGGTSSERLALLANEANNRDYQPGVNVVFGPPEPCDDGISNTQVLLSAVEDMGYDEAVYLYYDRLPLEALTSDSRCLPGPVPINGIPFTIHEILGAFNQVYRTDLLPEEVENDEFTERLDSYPLRIKEDVSLAWLASDFEFPVSWPFGTTLTEREAAMDRLHILVHQKLPEAMAENN